MVSKETEHRFLKCFRKPCSERGRPLQRECSSSAAPCAVRRVLLLLHKRRSMSRVLLQAHIDAPARTRPANFRAHIALAQSPRNEVSTAAHKTDGCGGGSGECSRSRAAASPTVCTAGFTACAMERNSRESTRVPQMYWMQALRQAGKQIE